MIAQPQHASWHPSHACRLSDGEECITIDFADNGLIRVHYSAPAVQVRQLCTFAWLVERLTGSPALREAAHDHT